MPEEQKPTSVPQEGGSYVRDPATGALKRVEDAAADPSQDAADASAEKPAKARKE